MDEICHKELTRLVLTNSTTLLDRENLETLVSSAVEPDQINKKLIAENIINVLTVPIEWLVDHSIRAKDLAKECMKKAIQARREGDPSWLRLTGWVFHYIADWGTPHHSPISKSNPVIASVGVGAVIGGIIGGILTSGKDKEEIKKGLVTGALAGAGVGGGIGSINLAIKHNYFEKRCDQRWLNNTALIKDQFITIKEIKPIRKQLDQALIFFNESMDYLRQECDNLPSDWIKKSDESEFAKYMVKIARVMKLAYQIILL